MATVPVMAGADFPTPAQLRATQATRAVMEEGTVVAATAADTINRRREPVRSLAQKITAVRSMSA
jgi:hypothetical protein